MNPHKTNSPRVLDPELQATLDGVSEFSWVPILKLSLFVLIVWGLGFVPWYMQQGDWPWHLEWRLDSASAFGDSFGFINSLMSSLALIGVIAAIWLQKQELTEQRKELMITQWELKKSAEAQQQSQKELAKQAKINLQSTVLTALEGMEKSARHDIQRDQDEAESTIKFVDRLRQLVIIDILKAEDETNNLIDELSDQLEVWRDCTYVIATCRDISRQTQFLLRTDYDLKTGKPLDYVPDDLDNTAYNMLLFTIESKIEKLRRASVRAGLSIESIGEWYETAKTRLDERDGVDVFNRLDTLGKLCGKLASETLYYRTGMFEE